MDGLYGGLTLTSLFCSMVVSNKCLLLFCIYPYYYNFYHCVVHMCAIKKIGFPTQKRNERSAYGSLHVFYLCVITFPLVFCFAGSRKE